MFKKRILIVSVVMLLISSFCLSACSDSTDISKTGDVVRWQHTELFSYQPRYSATNSTTKQEALDYELKLVQNEQNALKAVKNGRHLVTEIKWSEDQTEAYSSMMQVCGDYTGLLGFSSYRTAKTDRKITMVGGTADGYPVTHQMTICTANGSKMLEYSACISRDFSEINAQRYGLFLFVVFNLDINPDAIQRAVVDGSKHLNEDYQKTIYTEGDTTIEVLVQNINGTQCVVLHGIFDRRVSRVN